MNLAAIPTFASDDIFHVIVEAPRGSTSSSIESRWEAMSVSRPLSAGVTFPFDWGFVPSTEAPPFPSAYSLFPGGCSIRAIAFCS